MKKSLILLTLVISFLIVLSSQFISGYKGGGGQQDYHSICQSGNCIRLDGGGNYNCDNHNVGTTNNPCCSRSYCSGLTCVKEAYDRPDAIPSTGYTCPEQYLCQTNDDCNPCLKPDPCPLGECQESFNCIPNADGSKTCQYTPRNLGTTCTTGGTCDVLGNCCYKVCTDKECGDGGCGVSDECGTCQYSSCNNFKCFNEVYFGNMINHKINSANLNDRVKLIFNGKNLNGQTIEYKIYKKEVISNKEWYFPKNLVFSQTSNQGFTTWIANKSGEYYFTARVASNPKWTSTLDMPDPSYTILTVSDIEDNSKPFADIIKPARGTVWLKTTNIPYIQDSYDVDDYFDYSWIFDDSNTTSGNSDTFVNYNTFHKYQYGGQKTTNLSVVDERGSSDYNTTSILVIDPTVSAKYVFAGINSPPNNQMINANLNTVSLDGSDSFAVNVVVGTPPTISCIAGDCPSSTADGIAILNSPQGFALLTFFWTFDEPGNVLKTGIATGSKTFSNTGRHYANLKVNLSTGEKNSITNVFKLYFPCSNNGNIWTDASDHIFKTTDANDKCKGIDKKAIVEDPTSTDDCCPSGLTCKPNTGGFSCQLDQGIADFCKNIHICQDYNSLTNAKESCLNDNISCRVGINGAGTSGCGQVISNICGEQSSGTRPSSSCKCQWDDINLKCSQSGDSVISLFDGNVNLKSSCISMGITSGECVDGIMQLSEQNKPEWDALGKIALRDYLHNLPIDDPNKDKDADVYLKTHCDLSSLCFSGTKDVLCGNNSVKLGFFNVWNLLIAIISIIGIYSVIIIRRK